MLDSKASIDCTDAKQAVAPVEQQTVLCATRAVSRSDAAVSRASSIAQELGAQLLLLYVNDAREPVRAIRRRNALASNVLDAHARELARSGINVQVSVRSGRPYKVIADAAVEFDADLIVLGPYRRRVADSLLGTSAELIARRAERPVLVANSQSKTPYRHVLLTSDLSGMTAGVARVANKLGLLKRSRASIVHALEHSRKTMLYMAGVNEFDVAVYQRSLHELASTEIDVQLFSAGLDAEHFRIFSPQLSPLQAIEQTANRVRSDLVVVGCSRFAALKRLFVASVSNKVLQTTAHDVLLVSPAAARRVRRHASAIALQRLESDSPQRALRFH
jgi:nucleotide-binding universal stress UspA family protein